MDYKIIAWNYALALMCQGRTHSELVYVTCAVKGMALSWLGAWFCRGRLAQTWSTRTELKKMLLFGFILDTSFYWFHRLLHLKQLYRFHKLHHAATHPCPRDGIVASWLEIFLTGTVPFFGALWLTRLHYRVYLWLLAIGLPFVLIAHTSFDTEHLLHHKNQQHNFGNTRIWDVVCGTRVKSKP